MLNQELVNRAWPRAVFIVALSLPLIAQNLPAPAVERSGERTNAAPITSQFIDGIPRTIRFPCPVPIPTDQSQDQSRISRPLKVNVEVVQLFFNVKDKHGALIPHLN
jgi:hypothetical protein